MTWDYREALKGSWCVGMEADERVKNMGPHIPDRGCLAWDGRCIDCPLLRCVEDP